MIAKATRDAKEALKGALIKHKGDGSHPEVREALESLTQLGAKEREDGDGDGPPPPPLSRACRGRWRCITAPPFPGKLPDADDDLCINDDKNDGAEKPPRSKFTLGRMSFGMFKPTTIVCSVEDIFNIIDPIGETEGGDDDQAEGSVGWPQTYTIEVLMDIETSSAKLPARLVNYGKCFPLTDTRLGVKFTGGSLEPRFNMASTENNSLANSWKAIFDLAVTKEADAQSYFGWFSTMLMLKVMKLMMGLEPPVDTSDFTQTYTIGRPFTGYLDILYLDDSFRVTRGNKGTLVVVERLEEVDND